MRAPSLAFALGVAILGSGGCLGGSSAPAKFYMLVPAAGAPAAGQANARNLILGVGPVTVPAYLDRPQIVTRQGRDEVDLAEFDRWAEPLRDSIPRTLAENLSTLLGTERVSVFPWRGSRTVQYQVVVDVARFDGSLGGDVALEARWRILGADGKELALRRSTIAEATGAPDYGALVAAMSRALGALSRDIAGSLPR